MLSTRTAPPSPKKNCDDGGAPRASQRGEKLHTGKNHEPLMVGWTVSSAILKKLEGIDEDEKKDGREAEAGILKVVVVVAAINDGRLDVAAATEWKKVTYFESTAFNCDLEKLKRIYFLRCPLLLAELVREGKKILTSDTARPPQSHTRAPKGVNACPCTMTGFGYQRCLRFLYEIHFTHIATHMDSVWE